MARTTKMNPKLSRSGRIALGAFAALLLLLAGCVGLSALVANRVSVRRAEARLTDLPPAFDGTTQLYASDIDLCGLNTAEKSGALFRELQSLRPDILLLGGDYTSVSLLEILNRGEGDADGERKLRERSDFFHYISEFSAPLGKTPSPRRRTPIRRGWPR